MKIAVAGDGAGAGLARILAEHLRASHEVDDLSAPATEAERLYPHLADRVARAIRDGTYERAILVCGTGIGVCIVANKVPGVRAARSAE